MLDTQGSRGDTSHKDCVAKELLLRHDALKRESGRLRALDVKPESGDGRPAESISCSQEPMGLESWVGGTLRGQRRTRRATVSQQMVQDWRSGMVEAVVWSAVWFSC